MINRKKTSKVTITLPFPKKDTAFKLESIKLEHFLFTLLGGKTRLIKEKRQKNARKIWLHTLCHLLRIFAPFHVHFFRDFKFSRLTQTEWF